MATHAVPPNIWTSLATLFSFRAEAGTGEPAREGEHSALHAQRDLIEEAMRTRPDAFESELDVLSMMHMLSGRF